MLKMAQKRLTALDVKKKRQEKNRPLCIRHETSYSQPQMHKIDLSRLEYIAAFHQYQNVVDGKICRCNVCRQHAKKHEKRPKAKFV